MKNQQKATGYAQYGLPPQVFNAYPQDDAIKRALGSVRTKGIQEIDLKSTNYSGSTIPTIPYRLTNRGIDIQGLGSFLAGSVVTSEVVSGSGTSFTLANTPIAGTLMLFGNGLYLTNTVDYSISAAAITILIGTYTAGTIVAGFYMK